MKKLILVLLISVSCAGVSPRARLVQSHQGIQTLLASVDDSERIMCFGSTTLPSNPTVCTTEVSKVAGLTSQKHRLIREKFVTAYDAQIRLGVVISKWEPGQPVDVDTVLEIAKEISSQVQIMNSSVPDVTALISQIQNWIKELNEMKKLFGG